MVSVDKEVFTDNDSEGGLASANMRGKLLSRGNGRDIRVLQMHGW